MTEKELMTEALALAKLSFDEGEVPVGAVVALDGEIVGTGRNRRETQKNALCHAEIEAIDSACKKAPSFRRFSLLRHHITTALGLQLLFPGKEQEKGAMPPFPAFYSLTVPW